MSAFAATLPTMLASRLLSLLMLLQARGRLSAPALARQLEVSVRTIYRDIDSLSAAGVPVYGDKGRSGGFQLRDGWRTQLTGLTAGEVIEAEGGNDLTVADGNPTAVLIRQILGAVSQFDKSVTVNKLRSARIRKRLREGKCEGRKVYGHSDHERLIVLKVKGLRRKPRGGDAMSYQSIADELNREGIPTRGTEKGGPGKWQASTVRNICKRS